MIVLRPVMQKTHKKVQHTVPVIAIFMVNVVNNFSVWKFADVFAGRIVCMQQPRVSILLGLLCF